MEPERQPDGPPESVRAAGAVLRSRRHAEMVFDAVAALLGDMGWQETANDGAIRWLFRRDPADPELLVPWTMLTLSFGSRQILKLDWMGLGDAVPVEPPPPPPPPKLRGLGPGEIRIADGDEYVEIAFSEAGAKFETSRSHHPHPLAGLAPALNAAGGNALESLAQFVASLTPHRHGPGRVRLPTALPCGAAGVWQCGLRAMRRALFADAVQRGADWAVADGLTGKATVFGASRAEAWSAWQAAIARELPWPEPPPMVEPPAEVPEGFQLIRGPAADVPLPEPVPANVPAALVRLEPAPTRPCAFGSWVRLLGSRGATSFAACRRKRQGFTLIGQAVLGSIDVGAIDAEMDRVDEEHAARLRDAFARVSGGARRWPCRTVRYRVEGGGRLAFDGSSEGPAWDAGDLDGDVVGQRIVRQRWVT